MSQTYDRVNWVNETTRLNADNLNQMDKGIEDASKNIVNLEQKVTDGFNDIDSLTNMEIDELLNSVV